MVWPRDAGPTPRAPLLDVVRRTFVPNHALAAASEADVPALGALIPFIADKTARSAGAPPPTSACAAAASCRSTNPTRWPRCSPAGAPLPAVIVSAARSTAPSQRVRRRTPQRKRGLRDGRRVDAEARPQRAQHHDVQPSFRRIDRLAARARRQRVGHRRVIGGDPVHPRLPRPARRRRRGRRRPARQLVAAQRVQLAQAAGKPRRQARAARRASRAPRPRPAGRAAPATPGTCRASPSSTSRVGAARRCWGLRSRHVLAPAAEWRAAAQTLQWRGAGCLLGDSPSVSLLSWFHAGLAGDGRSCGREEPRQGDARRQQAAPAKAKEPAKPRTGRGREDAAPEPEAEPKSEPKPKSETEAQVRKARNPEPNLEAPPPPPEVTVGGVAWPRPSAPSPSTSSPRPERGHRRVLRPAVHPVARRRGGRVPGRARAGRRRRLPAPDPEERRVHPARARRADRVARAHLLLRRLGGLRADAARGRGGGAQRAAGDRQLRGAGAGRQPLHPAGGVSSTRPSRSRTGPRTPTPISSSARWSRARSACRATRRSARWSHGLLGDGVFYYSGGVFNGDGPDFRNLDNQPDIIGRMTVSPVRARRGRVPAADAGRLGLVRAATFSDRRFRCRRRRAATVPAPHWTTGQAPPGRRSSCASTASSPPSAASCRSRSAGASACAAKSSTSSSSWPRPTAPPPPGR